MKLFRRPALAFPVLDAIYTHDVGRLRRLLGRRFRADARSPAGDTYLHRVAAVPTPWAGELAAVLLDHGAAADAAADGGFRPLQVAAVTGNLAVADELVRHGAALDAVTEFGFSALHYAVSHDDPALVRWLLDRGANRRLASAAGETPLDIAYRNQAWDIADLFWDTPAGSASAADTPRPVFVAADRSVVH